MNVTLLFFAAARDAAGCSALAVDLPPSVTQVRGLLLWLGQRYPSLEPYLPCLRIAQNERFVDESCPIHDGDTLAVIPPVAGG